MGNIKLFYSDTETGNFGDMLNIDIFSKLFNCKIEWASIENCNIIALGSILNNFIEPINNKCIKNKNIDKLIVWGSGLIDWNYSTKCIFTRSFDIKALRGKLTKQKIELLLGKKLTNIVLGDPGLLASKLYPANIIKKYEWGIIPHYVDKNSPLLNKLKLKNSIIIDVFDKPQNVCKKISECNKILSSSLHGLIVADSYNIPNRRLIISDKIIGGDFKYNDYYSVFDLESHETLDLRKITEDIRNIEIIETISKDKIIKIQNDLIKTFPYK